jgi:hypothetical protein
MLVPWQMWNAYRFWSLDPTYTLPSATMMEEAKYTTPSATIGRIPASTRSGSRFFPPPGCTVWDAFQARNHPRLRHATQHGSRLRLKLLLLT